MFVIKRTSDGWYVTPSGTHCAYTPLLQRARVFDTAEQAERERCPGNEVVVRADAELQGRTR